MSRAVLAANDERPGAMALPADVAQRREMLVVQPLSYVLGDIVRLFAALSEFGVSDGFEDHYLTTPQSA